VKKVFQLALGIIAAIGGFVDIGDLVFNAQAGATYSYAPLWAVPVGVVGIVVYAEMSGRVSAIAKKPTFALVRDRYGESLGRVALVGSLVLTVLTLAAELGGLGFILNYFFDVSVGFFVLVGLLIVGLAARFLRFEGIERLFGYGGLALLVFVAASIHLDPNWGDIGRGFIPDFRASSLYWYFVVGLIAAALMPYEIYFYSSGALEEQWDEKDLGVNRVNAVLGFGLGGIPAMGVLVASAQVLFPQGIEPESLGTTALVSQASFGEVGLILALVGMLFAIGGATIDTAFSAAYNLAQYEEWEWGKRRGLDETPRFSAALVVFAIIAFAVVETGIDPVELTEYAVVFSAFVLPLSYLPVLLAARDRSIMGEHANGLLANTLGWLYFAVICVLAVAAPILLLATNGGGG
jgi:manganese transport protein